LSEPAASARTVPPSTDAVPQRGVRPARGDLLALFRLPPDVYAVMAITVASSFANGAVLPIQSAIRGDLNLSYAALGAIIAAFAIARTVFDLPGGAIADRYAPRPVFYVAGVMAVMGVLLTALAPAFTLLLAGRLINGVGAILGSLAATVYVARRTPPADRGRALGAMTAASLLGGFLSPVMVGALASWIGWRAGIGLVALPALAALLVVKLGVRARAPAPAAAPDDGRTGRRFFYAPQALLLVNIMGVTVSIGTFGMKSTVLPLYGSDALGLAPAMVGLAISLGSALGFPLSIATGALSDRWGRPAVFVPSALLIGTLGLVINLAAAAPAYFAIALGFSFDGSAAAMVRAMVVDRASPARLGAALGTSAFFRDLTMSCIPLAMGALISTWGFWGAGLAIALGAFVAALVCLRLGDTSPRRRTAGASPAAPSTSVAEVNA